MMQKGEIDVNRWSFYTTKEIKPNGWLKRQLEIQAEGLCGNLDKVWRDVRDSAWIGGDAEGWERVPYWLDGFIPLSYLLENEDMKSRAKKFIDAIINQQQEDGWIAPCSTEERANYDTWAVYLILKVLVTWYDCSADERIPDVLYKTLKNYYNLLKDGKIKLFEWGKYRWFECFIAINFTYERFGEDWLLELASMLKLNGVDYSKIKDLWKRPLNKWDFATHHVNISMMLKEEAVSCDILGEDYTEKADKLYDFVYKFNGRPTGLFTGDECLSGTSAIQGTELCAVVEQMYSYEHLFAYTGDNKWAELLELAAFNALPATLSDDMWTHQYDQMSNQISCIKFPGRSLFRTNGPDAHLFGLEPHFGCCTANFGQGFPKLAISSFMHRDDEIINVLPIPTILNDGGVRIETVTNYPFNNVFTYKISSNREFRFKIRIPEFAREVKVDERMASAEKEISFDIKTGETEISISYKTVPELIKNPSGLYSVKCGSLIFALPLEYEKKMYEYEKDGVERKFPYCDYEYLGQGEWNYAFCNTDFVIEERTVGDVPFSSKNPPLVIKAKMKKIDWGFEDGFETVCAKVPERTKPIGAEKTLELYPYGCAKLRMTEMPVIE